MYRLAFQQPGWIYKYRRWPHCPPGMRRQHAQVHNDYGGLHCMAQQLRLQSVQKEVFRLLKAAHPYKDMISFEIDFWILTMT